MRHASVFVLAAAAALAAPACTSLNGITDFKVDPAQGALRCTTNQECIDTVGEYNVCRKADGQCVSLLSAECATVFGPYQNDAAVTFGVMGALSGANASTGVSMRNAIELAVADLNELGGLPAAPGVIGRRPIVLVECDDKNNNDVALSVATHLSETLRLPAVFGSNSSSVSLKIFNDVFLKNQTLELAPAATATVFSTFDDQNLFWRTIPSLKLNVDGLVKAMPELEAHVRSQLAPPLNEAPISVGIIIKGDIFGTGSQEATISNPEFRFNGQSSGATENKAHFALANYGNPNASDMTTDFSATIQQMLDLKPNIIFMYGANEIIDLVLPQLEAQWSTTGAPYKPFYLFHANGFKVNLWQQIAKLDSSGTDLRKRVLGTNPGSIGSDFNLFRLKYTSKYPEDETSSPDSLGTMNSYDAVYALALATVAAGAEVSGPTLAQGMARLGSGQAIKVGNETATLTAFNLLSGGQTINLQGLTGPLDFDAVGDVVSDVYFYCVKQAGSAPDAAGTYPGTKFDPLERKLVASDGTGAYFAELKTYCGF
jgi:branched-chain amino acid transport system substrate-binding protein